MIKSAHTKIEQAISIAKMTNAPTSDIVNLPTAMIQNMLHYLEAGMDVMPNEDCESFEEMQMAAMSLEMQLKER